MGGRSNWSALSVVCLIQCVLCSLVLVAILLWKAVGGSPYEAARSWYVETESDTILVLPEFTSSAVESDG